jgi:DNA-binding transcriptional LysR family regulator
MCRSTERAAKHFVELRLLRYVIAVAEELHFGRAARRLHLSAPALSKQIKDLVHDLGYALFERRTREALLTPAGTAFAAEASQALLRVERAVEYGYAASRGDGGVLSFGYSPWFRPSILVALKTAFAERVPDTRLALHSAYSTTQIENETRFRSGCGYLKTWWPGTELNRRRQPFQGCALPTELPGLGAREVFPF